MTIKKIAKVCHAVNKAYCESIGDKSQPDWDNLPESLQNSAIEGVKFHRKHPEGTPEQSHMNWLKNRQKEGWKYAKVKNIVKKEHPCMLLYRDLPESQKSKDYLFKAVVNALS